MSALTIQITVMTMHPVQTMLVPLRVPVILATVVTALHVPILTNVQQTLTIAASTAHVQTQLVRSHAYAIQGIQATVQTVLMMTNVLLIQITVTPMLLV